MASNNSSTVEVPQAREAMDKFKMEVASELGVPLKNGYNGDLTSAQNGSVGGEMVNSTNNIHKYSALKYIKNIFTPNLHQK